MDEMIKSNWINKQSFFNVLQSLVNHPLVGCEALVAQDNDAILVDALNYRSSNYRSSNHRVGTAGGVIRFCSNVYRHCNDLTQHSNDRGFDLIEIEMKLTRAIPHLYLSLFEGILMYGIQQPSSKTLSPMGKETLGMDERPQILPSGLASDRIAAQVSNDKNQIIGRAARANY
ncbi:hypothetical protein V6N11_048437 [Hibiscus sabdariffa]|uniref:Uncharacterized protein n=1 Tax=Hibiscus sabdariffa TaxID=183260 RepID=A0ABR2PV96_9ROSI